MSMSLWGGRTSLATHIAHFNPSSVWRQLAAWTVPHDTHRRVSLRGDLRVAAALVDEEEDPIRAVLYVLPSPTTVVPSSVDADAAAGLDEEAPASSSSTSGS